MSENQNDPCQTCESRRLARVEGKCSDLGTFFVPHLKIDIDGYHPDINGICEPDYVDIVFCLDCGMIQFRDFPITDDELLEACPEDEE